MSFKTIVNNSRTWWAHASAHGAYRIRLAFHARPLASASVLVAAGLLIGVAGRSAAGMAQVSLLQAKAEQRDAELDQVRRGAQQEINAMAARLGELQAQANRLNALGERLTRVGQLQDGEFDFNEPVGVGGNDVSYDMKPAELVAGVDKLEQQFAASGRQLSVLEALLFNRELDRNATPGRLPIAKALFLTHGEENAQIALEETLISQRVTGDCILRPRLDDTYDLASEKCTLVPAVTPPRLPPESLARLDWHNDLAKLVLDINDAVAAAADERSRQVVLRRLRNALENDQNHR